ncbi:MAG: type II secretion system protein [Planctomycetota bacterium]
MKRKGITLIELLVLIVATTLFVAVLTPGLNMSRQTAVRLLCATNLRGIGSTMEIYAGDNEGQYPRSGGNRSSAGDPETCQWSTRGYITLWFGPPEWVTEVDAFDGIPRYATITSSFWLLVKYGYGGFKQFHCRGDQGATIFNVREAGGPQGLPLSWVWDFGSMPSPGPGGTTVGLWPGECVSYSYHMPFNQGDAFTPGFPISQVSRQDSPVCADRNPFLDAYTISPDIAANTLAHQQKGQNVLYKGGHVVFEQTPRVGLNGDNIWTYGGDPATGGGDPNGTAPTQAGQGWPVGDYFSNDAYLVNEVQTGTL